MTISTLPVTDRVAGIALMQVEARLRALHELRPEARLLADVEVPYVRFLRTLRERLHPRGVCDVRTLTLPDGLAFQVDLGDRLGCDAFYGYFEERFEAELFEEVLLDGETMIDVGANFGCYAVRCARAVGVSGAVHAFEPDPVARALLVANAAANRFGDRLRVHPFAVADQDRETSFHLAEEPAFSGLTSTGRSAIREVVQIQSRSLDSFAEEHGIDRLGALKIDVEGHEAAVLRGAESLLRRSTDPLLMLEVSAKNLTEQTRAELEAALGDLYAMGYGGLVPDPGVEGGLRTLATADEAAGLANANVLLLRPGGQRERRVRESVASRLAVDVPPSLPPTVDGDRREVRLFTGLDPDLVSAALRDKSEVEGRAVSLAREIDELRREVTRLRIERAALRAELARAGATPMGLAIRAGRRFVRALSASKKRALCT